MVSEDLTYQWPGDVHPDTANLTARGLQRTLLMATFLQQQELGAKNVAAIHALIPTTHPQAAGDYPDMAALMAVKQFALLNQIALPGTAGSTTWPGNSFPINASYAPGSLPPGVARLSPSLSCADCQGLEFDDAKGNNAALVN